MLQFLSKPFRPLFGQVRNAVANFRPKKMKFKKSFKGTFPTRTGGSIRGTTLFFGEYGLQLLEGGRLSDQQIDVARNGIKRQIKYEKEGTMILRCFPHRPVTKQAAETRMGKGKGSVDYFATWLAEGRVVFEVNGCRPEVAQKALKVAAAFLPLRTRIIERSSTRIAPRVLPWFIKQRLQKNEMINAINNLPNPKSLSK
jgi:ribosomal protein L16